MATRLYGTTAGETDGGVAEGVGSAVSADAIELTVDLATTVVNVGGSTRALTKDEVLAGIDRIKRKIITGNWPPA
jgi:hypothetical protein